jgi:hypothetical protein
MDLRDRSRGQRRAIEIGKQLFDRVPEAAFDLIDCGFCREGSDALLQALQGRDIAVGQHVAP